METRKRTADVALSPEDPAQRTMYQHEEAKSSDLTLNPSTVSDSTAANPSMDDLLDSGLDLHREDASPETLKTIKDRIEVLQPITGREYYIISKVWFMRFARSLSKLDGSPGPIDNSFISKTVDDTCRLCPLITFKNDFFACSSEDWQILLQK